MRASLNTKSFPGIPDTNYSTLSTSLPETFVQTALGYLIMWKRLKLLESKHRGATVSPPLTS